MKKPTCECFGAKKVGDTVFEDSAGESKTCMVALEISETFAAMMHLTSICPEAYEYTMVTCIVMLMKSIAAQDAKGDDAKEEAAFHAMIPWIAEAVRERGDQMMRDALVAQAGGLQ